MRRVAGYVLFTMGCLFIFLAPLLRFYATPRVEKAPTDVYDRSTSFGTGKIFSAKTFTVEGPMPLENLSIAKGNPAASTHDVAVISIFGRTINLRTHGDIDYSFDVYAMNRDTGYAIHCCGESPRHEGLTLKFPFGTKKQTYQFYDSTAHKAFPARYIRTETVDGLNSYMFVSTVPPTRIGTLRLPGSIAGVDLPGIDTDRWYKATTTVWVEPVTGAILKGAQTSAQWVTYLGQFVTTLAYTNFVNSPASVQATATKIKTQDGQLLLVATVLPIFGPVIGIVMIVVALLLLRSSPPRPAALVPPEPATAVA